MFIAGCFVSVDLVLYDGCLFAGCCGWFDCCAFDYLVLILLI